MCVDCEGGKEEEVSPWFYSMLRLYNLQYAGLQFHADDLTLEEWEDLAALKYCFNKKALEDNGK